MSVFKDSIKKERAQIGQIQKKQREKMVVFGAVKLSNAGKC